MPTILIVDDNAAVADTIALVLQDEGFDVRIAYEAASAQEEVGKSLPDIVLLDLGLPGKMNGLALGARLREMYGTRISLFAVTGNVLKYGESLPPGFDGIVIKPATRAALLAAIAHYCSR